MFTTKIALDTRFKRKSEQGCYFYFIHILFPSWITLASAILDFASFLFMIWTRPFWSNDMGLASNLCLLAILLLYTYFTPSVTFLLYPFWDFFIKWRGAKSPISTNVQTNDYEVRDHLHKHYEYINDDIILGARSPASAMKNIIWKNTKIRNIKIKWM